MFGAYSYIMQEEMKRKTTQETLQKLLDDGKYSYRVLMAFITLDNTFGVTKDHRKRRRAKRILRKHNVKFSDIKTIIDQSWAEEQRLYQTLQKVMLEKVPGLSALMSYI